MVIKVIPVHKLLTTLLLITIAANTQAQTIYYIKPAATGTGDGSSWANAGNDLQAVITNSAAGDQVWVAAGTYKPAVSDKNANFSMKNNLAIYGGFNGTESLLSQRNSGKNVTILSGDLSGNDIITASGTLTITNNSENSYHVIKNNGLNNTAVLDGFTITGGMNNDGTYGGGMLNRSSSPTITNVVFTGNYATLGGGMYNESSSAPVITKTVFHRNLAFGSGGGLYNVSSAPSISNVIFSGNQTNNSSGGGMCNFSASPIITNCTFTQNSVGGSGEGAAMYNGFASPVIKNCIFWGNLAGSVKEIQNGGGSPSVTYSVVQGVDVYSGAGNNNGDPVFTNAADPDGPDNIWMTADDGLTITCAGAAYGGGTGSIPAQDIIDNTRYTPLDMGAYKAGNGNLPVTTLPVAYTVVYVNQTAGFVNYTDCTNQVVAIDGTSPKTIAGGVTAKVWVDAAQNAQFVKRHYEITPAVNAAAATARITLYFTQAEFDDFNALNSLKLPAGPADAAGKLNLRIEKRAGTSSDNSGAPATYPAGTPVTIDPLDADITWNVAANRWQVSFDVAGFSGFFVKTNAAVLPLQLLNFTAARQNKTNKLQWKTANEANINYFSVERSTDGSVYNAFAKVSAANGYAQQYNVSDAVIFTGPMYYRLKITGFNGSFVYSNIAKVTDKEAAAITIAPNPATDLVKIQITDISLLNKNAFLTDAGGKIVKQFSITKLQQELVISDLSNGVYFIKFETGEVKKFIKQ